MRQHECSSGIVLVSQQKGSGAGNLCVNCKGVVLEYVNYCRVGGVVVGTDDVQLVCRQFAVCIAAPKTELLALQNVDLLKLQITAILPRRIGSKRQCRIGTFGCLEEANLPVSPVMQGGIGSGSLIVRPVARVTILKCTISD